MTHIDTIKIKAKYKIGFFDTYYTVRMKDTDTQIEVSEKALQNLLERISDMSEVDFIEFTESYSFGDYEY